MIATANKWLGHRPKSFVFALGLALTVLISFIGYVTSARLNFAVFYLMPLIMVTWFCGRYAGLWIAILEGVSSAFVEVFGSTHGLQPAVTLFNCAGRTGAFGVVVLLVWNVRQLMDRTEERVAQRTIELQTQIAGRQRIEEELRASEERFRQLTENINEVFWMTDVPKQQMIYVSRAYEIIWGRPCEGLYQSPQSWLDAIDPEDRTRVIAASMKQAAGDYDEQYRILRPDGSRRWIRDRAFPVYNQAGIIYRIAGIAEDVTEQKKLEAQLLEISDREQARIGHDLHDGLCQFLVGTAFDCNRLQQSLAAAGRSEAQEAEKISNLIDSAITQARQLARGLYPVQLEADGLVSALEELAASTSNRFQVDCRLECPEPLAVEDYTLATHLYRIAQEAVNNAARHARARTILIRLTRSDARLDLAVTDDGVGLPQHTPNHGMGLHIMDYRTRTLHGVLDIRNRDEGGTLVSCCIPAGPIT